MIFIPFMPLKFVCARLFFRVDISDTLMYVYEMLGAELLSNLYDKLGRQLTNTEQPMSWQVGEIHTNKMLCLFSVFIFVTQKPTLPSLKAQFKIKATKTNLDF